MRTTQTDQIENSGTPYTDVSARSNRDHKHIGHLYLAVSMVLFLLTAIFSAAEQPHALPLALLFLAPGIVGAFGNFVVPLQIGARNVAFPELNLLAFRLYAAGAVLVLAGIFGGGLGGWSMPVGGTGGAGVWLLGLGGLVVGISLSATAINLLVTITKLRAPGMTWGRLPLFVWGIYASSVAILALVPTSLAALVVLFFERTLGLGLLDAAVGGDPALLQNAFTVYGNPAAMVLLLPALAVVADIVPTFARKQAFAYRAVAHASFGLAAIGIFAWGHHAFGDGQSLYASTVFGFVSVLALGPLAVMVGSWLLTLNNGSIQLSTPLLYALGFIVLTTCGMFSGLFLSAPATAAYLNDTWMVVGHFDSFVVGGTAMALFGGAHYWWPKFSGQTAEGALGKVAAVVLFAGLMVAFHGRFVFGATGLSRQADLSGMSDASTQFATIGLGLVVLGGVLAMANLMMARSGGPAGNNPWGGRTLEWATQSPPIARNFNQTPTVEEGPYEYPVQGGEAEAH